MKQFLHSLFEIIETVAIAGIIVVAFRGFIGQPFLVDGMSMEPTFHDGDYLLIDQVTYRFKEPKRGDSIVFLYPRDPRKETYYIKRIIGLPGERVQVGNGEVSVTTTSQPFVLNESYIKEDLGKTSGNADVVLGNDEYFVMGDNRGASFDSRSWGPLKKEHVVGLVRFRLWPFTSVKAFHDPVYGSE